MLNIDDVKYTTYMLAEPIPTRFKQYKNIKEAQSDCDFCMMIYFFYKHVLGRTNCTDIDCYLDIKARFFVYYDLTSGAEYPEMEEMMRRDDFYKEWYEDVSGHSI